MGFLSLLLITHLETVISEAVIVCTRKLGEMAWWDFCCYCCVITHLEKEISEAVTPCTLKLEEMPRWECCLYSVDNSVFHSVQPIRTQPWPQKSAPRRGFSTCRASSTRRRGSCSTSGLTSPSSRPCSSSPSTASA